MLIRNALLICLDTTRAQSLSLYGHPHPTGPYLDHYAAGVVFERCLSPHIPTQTTPPSSVARMCCVE